MSVRTPVRQSHHTVRKLFIIKKHSFDLGNNFKYLHLICEYREIGGDIRKHVTHERA